MRGTWQTTDSSGVSGKEALLILGAVVLLGSGGAVAAVSQALIDAVIAVAVLTVLAVAGLGALVVHRARHPEAVSRMIPRPQFHELPGPERPAVPQHFHLHLHGPGPDPAAVAEILRRSQRPEQ